MERGFGTEGKEERGWFFSHNDPVPTPEVITGLHLAYSLLPRQDTGWAPQVFVSQLLPSMSSRQKPPLGPRILMSRF